MAANTTRNDAAFIQARDALAQKLLAKRSERVSFSQHLANGVSNAGNGIGVVAGALPSLADNFGIAYQSQKELQVMRSARFALEQAEKVLRA